MPTQKRRPRGTGAMRQLTSGRWQASFRGPDGVRRPAPLTFDTKIDADGWLKAQRRDVERDTWAPPEQTAHRQGRRLRDYAETWLDQRDLKPSTRALYRGVLDSMILPPLGETLLDKITPTTVRTWYSSLDAKTPTRRAHAYSLLHSILATAFADELVPANPCRIRAAGSSRRVREPRPATLPELEAIADAVPARYQAMILLAAWCALRFGELTELRRADVDTEAGVVRVRRGVTRVGGTFIIGEPKSTAGRRTVAIPPHLMPMIETHLREHTAPDPGALLFPARGGGHMRPSTLYTVFYPAREVAGRADLRFHDLRHTGATLAAATGATLAELMSRLGHSTPAAALVYQHAAADRDRAIADALSTFATATVVPLQRRGKRAQ